MKNSLRIIAAAAFLMAAVLPAKAQSMPLVSYEGPLPECVHPEASRLEFPGSRDCQDAFCAKVDSMLASRSGNVTVWHVGGSHVQGAVLPNGIMYRLLEVDPEMKGERGVLFPRRILKTNSDLRYRISFQGEWTGGSVVKPIKEPAMEYGLSGFAAHTSDTLARVGFGMRKGADSTWTFSSVKIHGYGTDVQPYLLACGDSLLCSPDDLSFQLPAPTDSATLGFNFGPKGSFVLKGIEPISAAPGFRYYASGVNGATLSSWTERAAGLQADLDAISPDLAIFGIGINDASCAADRFKADRFLALYRKLIGEVRAANPSCAIIFVTNNDCYRYVRRGMVHNENGATVRELMRQLAAESGAAVWDLYGVMGGSGSVTAWRDQGLAKRDRIHFTEQGYALVADLLYNSIASDFNGRRTDR